LRFVVVHDRYNQAFKQQQRTLEDMKDRYYQVVAALAKAHGAPIDSTAITFKYDRAHEERRRTQLRNVHGRTWLQVREEAQLRESLKRITAKCKAQGRELVLPPSLLPPAGREKKKEKKAKRAKVQYATPFLCFPPCPPIPLTSTNNPFAMPPSQLVHSLVNHIIAAHSGVLCTYEHISPALPVCVSSCSPMGRRPQGGSPPRPPQRPPLLLAPLPLPQLPLPLPGWPPCHRLRPTTPLLPRPTPVP